jgi:hypothetical protein
VLLGVRVGAVRGVIVRVVVRAMLVAVLVSVVVTIVTVIMSMLVSIVTVIMSVVVLVRVTVPVSMRGSIMRVRVFVPAPVFVVAAAAVGATLGRERSSLESDLGPEAANHVVEHVVVAILHAADLDLQRHVPVAEVVSDARQEQHVFRASDAELLVGRAHEHAGAGAGLQKITVGEHGAARQLHGELPTCLEFGQKAVLLPRIKVEHDGALHSRRLDLRAA